MLKIFTRKAVHFINNFSAKRLKSDSSLKYTLQMSDTKVFRKVRYDGRTKKRQWEERRSDKGESFNDNDSKKPKTDDNKSNEEALDKVKRRKFCLLMGYSGVEYYGMQRNPNTKTIEEDLFTALLKVRLINEDCFNQAQNMQFQRAARTDKGVSAARQIVSMKLAENIDLSKINAELPEAIRVFAYRRVTKGFNSKTQCDGRTYIYMLPTVSFAEHTREVSQKDYRMSDEIFTVVNQLLQNFIGTKNFHNYTSKKKPNDPSAVRYIKSFICEKPFVRKDVEFAVLKIQGQSFMLHQIRKMVGFLLAVVRGLATVESFNDSFKPEKTKIHRAPGLGLILEYVHYDRYNNRYGEDGMHQKLTWEEVENDVNEFKEKYIYPTIINTEIEQEPMVYWLKNKLSRHLEEEDNESDEDDEVGDDDDRPDERKPELCNDKDDIQIVNK